MAGDSVVLAKKKGEKMAKPGDGGSRQTVSIKEMFQLATNWELTLLVVGNIGAMVNGISQPVLTLLFGDIIDVMTDSQDELMDSLEEACVKITIAGAIAAVFAMIQSFCFKYFAEKQAFRYRGLYIQSVLHQDVEWFDARSVASLPTQMSIDAERIGEAFGDKLAMSAMSWWGVIGGVGCAIIAGWQIGLVGLIVCPFMGIAAFFMAQAGEQMSGETQTWYKRAQLVVEECLYAFRTVVAFGSERQELVPFDEAIEQARQGAVRGGVKIGASYGFANMSMYILYALTVWYGGVLIYDEVDHPTKQGVYTPGSILACLFCIEIAGFSIGMLPPGITAFQTGRGSMARFLDAYVTPCKIECTGKDQRAICPEIESFELSKVYFSYPTRPEVAVLRNLSLKIDKGSKVAVVGESGSGKSTVMALLERFYDPDAGVVFVNGMNMKNFSVKSLRRNIGYVGQEPVLFATSVKENILQGSSISENTDAELERVVAEAELGFVKDLPEGLHTYVGSGGCQFSGGQKQRIVIARALIKKTSVLFFDEATSALDNKSEKMIQHTIDRIGAMAGGSMTMVSIAHRLTTIRNCDLIFVLSRGEAVESGAHDELIELHGTYYALVAAQQVAEAKQVEEAEAAPAPVQGREAAKAQKSQARALQQQSTAGAAPAVIGAAEAAEEEVALPNGKDTASSLDLESLEKARIKQVAKEYKVPMGRVMSFCKPEWVFIAPGLLGAMIDGSALPLSSIMLTSAAKTMAESGKGEVRDTMQFLATLLVALAVIDFCACLTQHACLALVGEGMVMRMRRALLLHFFRQEVGFHDDPAHSPAILGQALELWTYRMSNLVKAWGGKLGALTAIIVGVTTAFIFSWEMALGVLLVIPLMVAMNLVQFILMFGATSADSTGQRAQQVLSDSVQNARICHACVNEDAIVSLYMHLLDKSTQGLVKRTMVAALGYGLSMGMMFWILAAGFYYGGKLAVEGQREFSDVTSAFMGVFFAAMGAGQCAATLGDASKAKVAAHDMFKLLDRKSKIDSLEPTGEVPMLDHAMDAGEISFEAVRFRYPFRPDVEVLKGMTFSVRQGQAVGLVGPSGGGKSTVMAMIQRFYDPDEGSVLIGPGKQVLSNLHIRWWRQQLGFVGQEPILFNTTVKGNLVYGLSADAMPSDEWIEQCARMANLAFLDNEPKRFETEVGPRGSRLSGGQKQRVAICRALIRNPPVLLFDEATSALDSQSEQIVQSALETVRQGRTSFSIAHRLSTIANCDVILVVASGKMVEEGSHQELLDADGVYAKLAQAANAGHGKSSGKQ